MSSGNPDWEDQRAFLQVIESGSISVAARTLRLTHATVRRRVEALEQAIGRPLFTRGVNGLVPTEEARALAEHVRRMAFASAAFGRAAADASGELAGTVRVSVSDFVGTEVLPAMLPPLLQHHPKLAIELVLSNDSADLLHQEADIAVRMHPPRQDALIARHVGRIGLALFASRSYAARHELPKTLADVAEHPLIGPDRSSADLALLDAILKPALPHPRFALRSDSHPAQLAAIRAGLGIGVVQVPIGRRELVPVLPELVLHTMDVWIVAHEDLRRSVRIDALYRHLVGTFEVYCRT